MAAWLPWEIQIQSVVTRLCFWISLNREQMLAQKTGRTTPRDDPQETYETYATVTFRSCRVYVWNVFHVPFLIWNRILVGCGWWMELCCRWNRSILDTLILSKLVKRILIRIFWYLVARWNVNNLGILCTIILCVLYKCLYYLFIIIVTLITIIPACYDNYTLFVRT